MQFFLYEILFLSSQCHNGIIQVLRLGIMIMFELCHRRENRALFVGEASGMTMSSCQVFSAPASSIAEPAPAAESTACCAQGRVCRD